MGRVAAITRSELAVMLVVIAGFLAAVASALWLRAPLGHDESVYVLRARDLGDGWSALSGSYWSDYRAPGLPVLLRVGHLGTGLHVSSARAIVGCLGASIVVSTWWLGRLVAGRAVGVIAAALTASSFSFMVASSTLLADVPGAAFVLPAVSVYLIELRRGVLRWSFVVVPALAFFGTVSRFGAPFMLASGLVGVTILTAPAIARARNWVLLAQVLVLALALALVCGLVLLTEFVTLGGETPVVANQQLVGSKSLTFSTGLSDLVEVVNPWADGLPKLSSPFIALAFLLGLFLVLVGFVRRRVTTIVAIGVAVAATLSVGALVGTVGLVVSTYLVLTLPYWAILAALGLAWPLSDLRSRLEARQADLARTIVTGLGVLVIVAALVHSAIDTRSAHGKYTHSYQEIRSASTQTGRELGPNCLLITSYAPQAGYYSGCRVWVFAPLVPAREGTSPMSSLDLTVPRRLVNVQDDLDLTGYAIGVLIVESGKRQPPDVEFDDSATLDETRLFEYGEPGDRRRHVWLQLVEPCALDNTC